MEVSMDMQPMQTTTPFQASTASRIEQPRDLTWLGLADDAELLSRAREIARHNLQTNRSAKVFDGMVAELNSWEPVEEGWSI
jgi:hypothetical protein